VSEAALEGLKFAECLPHIPKKDHTSFYVH
jgi:hypothetical protein